MRRVNSSSFSGGRFENGIQPIDGILCDAEDPVDQSKEKIENKRDMKMDNAVEPCVKLSEQVLGRYRDTAEGP